MSQYQQPPLSGPMGNQGPMVAEDPGRTLGIVGLVLAFFLSVVGLILSIVAYQKSKAAGYKNGIALAGIIVGAVLTVLGIVYAVVVMTLLPGMMNGAR